MPGPVSDSHVYGVSNDLAIIHWIVPRITYTPERYYIQYRTSNEDGSGQTFMSSVVTGSSDLSAQDVEYDIVLDGLSSGTFYTANLTANNSLGSQVVAQISFATSPLGE